MQSPLGVEEVSTTAGTGPYALGGPTPNSFAFRAKIANGALVTYQATDGARSEYGKGTFGYPATLSRDTIISSSNADTAVSWPTSGQRIISLVIDEVSGIPAGGEECQLLAKNSDADFDAGWKTFLPFSGQCAQILVHTDGVECFPLEWQWRPYPIAAWVPAPEAAHRVELPVTEYIRIERNFNGSWAYARVAPSDDCVITVNRIRGGSTVALGDITFAAHSKAAIWHTVGADVSGGSKYMQPGDRIEFLFPSIADDAIEDVSITARGVIYCGQLEAVEPFTAGAVYFDGSTYLWNFPPMEDSPVGSLSYWIYMDDFPLLPLDSEPGPIGGDGDLHQAYNGYIIIGAWNSIGWQAISFKQGSLENRVAYTPNRTITNITSANPAVVTFAGSHDIQAGSWVLTWNFKQAGWDTVFDLLDMKVLSATSTTMTLDFDTTSCPAYIPDDIPGFNNDNTIAEFRVYNATSMDAADDGTFGGDIPNFPSARAIPPRTWVNVCWSWDMNHPAGSKIVVHYINDDPVLHQTGDNQAAFSVNYSSPNVYDESVWAIGGDWIGYDPVGYGLGINCCLAEFWFAPGQFIDFTDPAERAKFRNAGKPAFLGEDGSLPTGTAPALYQHIPSTPLDPYQVLGLPLRFVNLRYGGSDTVSGTLANGITGTHTFVLSCWFWGDRDNIEFAGWGSYNISMQFYDGLLGVIMFNAAGTHQFEFRFSVPRSGVNNVCLAVDTNHAIGSKVVLAYVNNSPVSVTVVNDMIDNLLVTWTDADKFYFDGTGFISDWWIAPDQFFDPINKFMDVSGNPIDPGENGELISGTAPSFFFKITGTQPATEFGLNLGTGGEWVPYEYEPGASILVPEAAGFLKNNTGGEHMHMLAWFASFNMAPTNPSD
jgi:hypothetical protein